MDRKGFRLIGEHILGSFQRSEWKFPTRSDYEKYLIEKQIIEDTADLWYDEQLVIAVQRHWHNRGQNGCVFAQVVANKAAEYGWRSVVIQGGVEQIKKPNMKRLITSAISKSIHDPDCEIISFLFPEIVDPLDLVFLIRILMDTDKIILHDASQIDDMITIALRVAVSDKITPEKIVLSWLMGFGPFKFFPTTRQAPVTELVIRAKPKPEKIYEKLNQDRMAAHLADVPLRLADQAWPRIWESTLRRTRIILEAEPDSFSAARTTFSIPWALWLKPGA